MTTQHQSSARRLDFDWLRIGAFALLILYHVGMLYVSWDFHVKSAHLEPWLEPLMCLVNPWRLTLLFIISGAASRFMLDKLKPMAFARLRLLRLMLPLLFGMFVIVPPQTYWQLQQSGQAGAGALDFYFHYVTASGGWTAHAVPLITPTWNHLWFVAYLLLYTLGLAVLCRAFPRLPAAATRRLDASPFALAVAVPLLWLTFVHAVVRSHFPETHALVADWTVHLESASAFLFGFCLAKAVPAWGFLQRRRRGLLAAASLVSLVHVAPGLVQVPASLSLANALADWMFAPTQWFSCLALFGYAGTYLRTLDHPVRRYLTEAIFPFYIVHQTLIIALAAFLRPMALSFPVEGSAIVAGTTMGCFLTFEAVRRSALLRPLFGLRGTPSRPPSSRAGQPVQAAG